MEPEDQLNEDGSNAEQHDDSAAIAWFERLVKGGPSLYFMDQIEARMREVYEAWNSREPDTRPPNWFTLDYKCAHLMVMKKAYTLINGSGLLDLTDLDPVKLEKHLADNPISDEDGADEDVAKDVEFTIQSMWSNMIQAIASNIYRLQQGDWTEPLKNGELDLADELFNKHMRDTMEERISGTLSRQAYFAFDSFQLMPVYREVHHRCIWTKTVLSEDGEYHQDMKDKEVNDLIIKAIQSGDIFNVTLTLSVAYCSGFSVALDSWF